MQLFSKPVAVLAMGLSLSLASSQAQANWPAWRGSHDNGSTGQGTYPVECSPSNALWTARLPGKGCSTPVIWNRRLFLTAPSNGLDGVLGFDWHGRRLWLATFGAESPGTHAMRPAATHPPPLTDRPYLFDSKVGLSRLST
jgi:outer membrane protein assembly factor BamB